MHAHSRLMCINAGVDDAAQWCVAEVVSKAQIPLFKHVKVKYNCSVMHFFARYSASSRGREDPAGSEFRES